MLKTPGLERVKFILMDVEGTTTDINFVKEILFPYSARELRNFVSSNKNNPTVRECLKQTNCANDEDAIIQLLDWIKQDVKHQALKTLQGLIWKGGYESGAFKGHVYADVVPAFQSWRASGLHLGIYSSGSVAAQKLLFANTTEGSLLNYLENHFDLEVGGKRDIKSYRAIADSLHLSPEKILFLSDVPAELDAAQTAGFHTGHIVRPGTQSGSSHLEFSNFTDI